MEIAADEPHDEDDGDGREGHSANDVEEIPRFRLANTGNQRHPWHNSPDRERVPITSHRGWAARVTDDRDNGGVDDLFEPFDLDDFPVDGEPGPGASPAEPPQYEFEPSEAAPPPPVTTREPAVPTVRCSSCGSLNPTHNRHCEECGARLSQGRLPVAPPPMVRSTPGGRALGILLAVVALVALIALFLNIFGGDGDTDTTAQSTTSTSSTTPTVTQTELQPASVDVSSELAGFEGENLIDGSAGSYWNDSSQRGVGAVLTFTFAQPVAISEMELQNITDDTAFRRNYRIKDFQVTVDDLAIELPYTMPDNNDPQRFGLNTLETRRLTLTVLETYVGEPVGDQPSFTELALAEVRFFGTVNN